MIEPGPGAEFATLAWIGLNHKMGDLLKVCNACNMKLPLDNFHAEKRTKDGRKSKCKACVARYNQGWRVKNRDRIKANHKEYYQQNSDKFRSYEHKRRSSTRQGLYVSARSLAKLNSRFQGLCAYCCVTEQQVWDHVIPLSRGGRHAEANLLPACRSCNGQKYNKLLSEWRYRV